MARQDIYLGVEGNDGTGDSIREAFKKANENFTELYAVFGQGGTISFTALSDTPTSLTPNGLLIGNTTGTELIQKIFFVQKLRVNWQEHILTSMV